MFYCNSPDSPIRQHFQLEMTSKVDEQRKISTGRQIELDRKIKTLVIEKTNC